MSCKEDTLYAVREARLEDSVRINAVSRYLGYKEQSNEMARDKLSQILSSKTDNVYVAEHNGVVVGWLHLFLSLRLASPDFYEIGGLVVSPEYRRQGIGQALVAHVADRHNGKVRVRCNDKRVETHEFYEAIGFKGIKVQRIFETLSL